MKLSNLDRLGWMLRRLSCMSPAEIGYRIEQSFVTRLENAGIISPSAKSPPTSLTGETKYCTPTGVDASVYLAEAERILDGHVPLFGTTEFLVGFPTQWNTDPLTGINAPASFGLRLPITNRDVVGDIKHIWELNRHLHLVRVAQAYSLCGDHRYAAGLVKLVGSWLDQCPPMSGPNWSSSLELGIRLINWSLIWRLLGGWNAEVFSYPDCPDLRERWLASIYAHCAFIRRHLSRHSSANNHLIGELAGLYAASRTWPYWPDSGKWSEFAKNELEQEILAQYSTDGVNREQATAYHVFATEFLVFAGICGSLSNDPFSPHYWQSLNRTRNFLKSIRDVACNTPMFGDADDGIVWRLEPRSRDDRAGQLVSLLEVLLQDTVQEVSDTANWLLGGAALDHFPKFKESDNSAIWSYPEGGYLIFGSQFGTPREIKGIVDCGPLGYLGIAAHGHADALSLVLSVGGEECLVDSGTFSYWNDLKWRDYFRGTSAHNTLRIDALDQSVSGGRFMWTRKASCNIRSLPSSPDCFEFVGAHDGYTRLDDTIEHCRSVKFDGRSQCLEVKDSARGRFDHLFEQFWHFAPDIKVSILVSNCAEVVGKNFRIHVTFFGDNLALDMYRGNESPILGWHSSSYETKVPCTSLRVSTISRELQLNAVFSIHYFDGR